MSAYWRIAVRPHRREAAAIIGLMLAGAVLDAVSVGLTVPLLDVLTHQGEAVRSPIVESLRRLLASWGIVPQPNAMVVALLASLSLFFAVRSGLVLWAQCATAAIAIRLRRRIKVALFEKFLHARYEEIAKRARGTVVHDINDPAEALTAAMINLGYLCTGAFNSLIMTALLFYLSWWATLLVGGMALLGVQGWRWYADHRAARHGRILYDLRGEMHKLQVDAIDGLKVVKAHGLERRLTERQDQLSSAEFAPELAVNLFRYGPLLINELIAIGLVLGLGAITFLLPSAGLRVSMLVAFLLGVRRIAPALSAINAASVNLSKSSRDLEIIEEVMSGLPGERLGGRAVERVEEIALDGVSFAYASRPSKPVLIQLSASMRRGTVSALVGPTGAGKSTVANLLLGLYDPQAGAIRVNGVDLRALDLAAWRGRIGYVSQDIFVFNASIHDNIALGDQDVSAEQVAWAARTAQLDVFIDALPDGYDTLVGDRGLRLSGGQCQRLAIARAVLRRPDVLIFDEATSALDNLTERAVYNAISALRRQAVVIVIAHRLSTVREADQILVIQAGRIAEQGTHEALMSQRGVYAGLYEEDARTGSREARAEDAVARVAA